MGRRYVVRPCDNDGSVSPAPPRDRTWDVVDTYQGVVVANHDSRRRARDDADAWNKREVDYG